MRRLRELRLREMYYDILVENVRSQGCVMYLNFPQFVRSIGTDSIYFGTYDISHDHTKYEISVNERKFKSYSYPVIEVATSDTLTIGAYRVRLTGETSLDTIRDELTLVRSENGWRQE
jgi:hypothetical protein